MLEGGAAVASNVYSFAMFGIKILGVRDPVATAEDLATALKTGAAPADDRKCFDFNAGLGHCA
jgi:hypothetical protein